MGQTLPSYICNYAETMSRLEEPLGRGACLRKARLPHVKAIWWYGAKLNRPDSGIIYAHLFVVF